MMRLLHLCTVTALYQLDIVRKALAGEVLKFAIAASGAAFGLSAFWGGVLGHGGEG